MIELSYEEQGHGDAIVILHGLFGSRHNWRSIARGLSPDYRVITVDLRNHGDSPHADGMGYREMADDVLALLNRLGLGDATLLGHSMGGKVAMTFALTHQLRTRRLIVVDIAPVNYQHCFTTILDALHQLDTNNLASRAQADDILRSSIEDDGLRQFLLQNLVRIGSAYRWRINLAAIERAIDEVTKFPEFDPNIAYAGPSLFVGGQASSYIAEEYHETIAGLFPGARIDLLPDAGHWLHAEQPGKFLSLIREFISSQ